MKEYTSDVHILPFVSSYNASTVYYMFSIYSDTNEVKDYYKYQLDVNEGECLINGDRLIDFNDDFLIERVYAFKNFA